MQQYMAFYLERALKFAQGSRCHKGFSLLQPVSSREVVGGGLSEIGGKVLTPDMGGGGR